MMMDNYLCFDINGKTAYVKRDYIDTLNKVSTIIFDCDGVLIDARDSYNRSISWTVSYLAENLMNTSISKEDISDLLIYNFRKSGGFNNDWDTTYAILLYLFTRSSKKVINKYSELFQKFHSTSIPTKAYDRVLEIKKLLSTVKISNKVSKNVQRDLLIFSEMADSRGIISLIDVLPKIEDRKALLGFSMVMSYPEKVGISTITTVFEEFFLGSNLFFKKYGFSSIFLNDFPGLVFREVPILTDIAMNMLIKLFGESNFGIVSGRSYFTAEYTLGPLIKYFNSELNIFIDDEIFLALKKGDKEKISEFSKPHPYSLLKVEKNALKTGNILYVGDSMEDLIMVKQSNNFLNRFIAAGVYGYSDNPETLVKMFVKNNAYIITESVNDIPYLFKIIMSDKNEII